MRRLETAKRKRKPRSSKPKLENHYKVLGVRSNSRPERIKENYIQMVKQYPPEQFPEEFEQIRRAYEILKDPIKRQEYDLKRNLGGSFEETMDKFLKYVEQGKLDQAEKLMTDLLKIAPDFTGARLSLAQLYLIEDDFNEFEHQMQLLLDGTKSEEEQADVLAIKVSLLTEMDYFEEASDVINLLHNKYPSYVDKYRAVEIQFYMAQDRSDEALRLFELEVPPVDDVDPDHIFFFIAWINTMLEAEKWAVSDKIQKRVRKFIKMIQDEDDRLMVASAFIDECEAYFEGGYFRAAGFYIDLLHYLDPKHPFVHENRRNIQELARIEKEINRQLADDDLFPLVTFQSMQWFYEEVGQSERAFEFNDMIPFEFRQELEMMDEEFAAGIKRLQKKYPLIYRHYKKDWDILFDEKTADLNREARRRLR